MDKSSEQYRRIAVSYDRKLQIRLGEKLRGQAFESFSLRPGDTVVDVGCGTGLSFPVIEAAIGTSGRIIGVEPSLEMLERARGRVEDSGWQNVTLVQAPADKAILPAMADAIVIFRVHEVMRSAAALNNIIGSAAPGARVLVSGVKWAPWWAFPLNLVIWRLTRRVTTTREGFSRPWDVMAGLVPDLRVRSMAWGTHYVALGTTASPEGV